MANKVPWFGIRLLPSATHELADSIGSARAADLLAGWNHSSS